MRQSYRGRRRHSRESKSALGLRRRLWLTTLARIATGGLLSSITRRRYAAHALSPTGPLRHGLATWAVEVCTSAHDKGPPLTAERTGLLCAMRFPHFLLSFAGALWYKWAKEVLTLPALSPASLRIRWRNV